MEKFERFKEAVETVFRILMALVGISIIGFFLLYMMLGKPNSAIIQSTHDLNFEEIEESTNDRIYFEKNPDDVYILSFENGEIFKDSGTLCFRAKNVRKDGEDIIFEFENSGNIVWDTSTKMAVMYKNGRSKTYENVEIQKYEE